MSENDHQRPKSARPTPNPLSLMAAASEVGIMTGVLCLGGWWLDDRWGTEPWLLLLGMTLGLISGFYRLWKLGKKFFD